jgi:predicted nucleotidyltransferase
MPQVQAPAVKMPSVDDPVLAQMVQRLVDAYHPHRIYLFGSVARGDVGPDSDYDLMIIVPDDAPAPLRKCDLAYEVLRGFRLAKDLLVWTRSDFEKRLHLKASLPSTILREGKLLYAA